jgi:pimeloyl-ACP methyl ester carboxylesterase
MSIAPQLDRRAEGDPPLVGASEGPRLSPRGTMRDGRPITYGACRNRGEPIVLVSGAVPDEVVWRPQIDHLRDHRFLSWTPRLPGASASLAESLAELEQICDEEGAVRPWIFGWGAGVRWALEAARAGRARGVAIVSGLGGRVFGMAAALAAPLARDPAREDPPPSAVRTRATAPSAPRLRRLFEATGVFGPHLAAPDADEIAAAVAEVPLATTLARVIASPSRAALAAAIRVEVPALVIAGDADPLMPAALSQQLGRALSRARVRVLRGGGHFVTRELADYLNLELGRFVG